MCRVVSSILIILGLLIAGCGPTPTPSPATPTLLPSPTPYPTPTPIPELTTEEIISLAPSSVFIEAMVEEEGELITGWSGSGTIITSTGLILTNAHVVLGAESLVISMISRTDQPPIPSYIAEPIEVNSVLDLALIHITSDLDGNPIEVGELRFPFVMRGNSDVIDLGQDIHVLGYPGVGGETVTFTKGTISGFESEDLGSGRLERVWIKSDTEIAPGNSGGTAVDDQGLLIGIPTLVLSEDQTAGRLSRFRPSNLVNYLFHQAPPKIIDASIYEPNDYFDIAYGPLESGNVYSAFLHEYDFDFYYIEVETLEPIWILLSDIHEEVDYDLYLLSESQWTVEYSESETTSEYIIYQPRKIGVYYILVAAYEGHSLEHPYILQPIFDGKTAPPILPEATWVTVQGYLLDADTGLGIEGGLVSLLQPGVTGEQFWDENLNQELVQVSSTTDAEGLFILPEVPRGQTYTMVVITKTDTLWVNDWLTIEVTDPAIIDLGEITIGAP